jgi:hypothetical protein
MTAQFIHRLHLFPAMSLFAPAAAGLPATLGAHVFLPYLVFDPIFSCASLVALRLKHKTAKLSRRIGERA